MAHTNSLRHSLERNEERLFVFPLEGLQEAWRQNRLRTAHKAAGFVAPVRDTMTAYQICKDLGIQGRAAVTTLADGRSYVIIKGYPGVRSVLTGTRYLETNVKVVKLAIGRVGLGAAVAEGAMLTIVLYTGIDILEYVLEDNVTLSMLSANLATDLLKVGIGAVASLAAGLAFGGLSTIAVGPLVAAIFVGAATSAALDYFDSQYGATDKLITAIDECGEKLAQKNEEMQKTLELAPREIERGLIWRMYKWDIDNPRGF
jgi:hypothetical protein